MHTPSDTANFVFPNTGNSVLTTSEPSITEEDPDSTPESVQTLEDPDDLSQFPELTPARHVLEGLPISYPRLRSLAPRQSSNTQLESISDTLIVSGPPTAHHRIVQLNLALTLLEHIRTTKQGQLYIGLEHHFFEILPDATATSYEVPPPDDALWIVQEDVPRPSVPPGAALPRHVLVPDICLLSADQEVQRQTGWLQGAPQLVVEVLSSPTQKRALSARRSLYQNWGALEYWVVDMEARAVRVHRLQTGERMKNLTRADSVILTPILPGFGIELSRLFDMYMCVGDPAVLHTLQAREQALQQAIVAKDALHSALADERKAKARAERNAATEASARDRADKKYQQENDRRVQIEALASVLQHRVEREISLREAADLRLEVEVRTSELLRRQLNALTATLEAERAFKRKQDEARKP